MLSVVRAQQATGLPFPNAERVGNLCIAMTAAASSDVLIWKLLSSIH